MTFEEWIIKSGNDGFMLACKEAWDYQQARIDALEAELTRQQEELNLLEKMFAYVKTALRDACERLN